MSDRMTAISLPGRSGLAAYGRRSVDEMIADLRRMARHDMERAKEILDAPDEAFRVETYLGVYAHRNCQVIQEGRGRDE